MNNNLYKKVLPLLFILYFSTQSFSQFSISIQNAHSKIETTVNEFITDSICVQVQNGNQPVANAVIFLQNVSKPSKALGVEFSDSVLVTNAQGKAYFTCKAGNKKGEYFILVSTHYNNKVFSDVIEINAKSKLWIIFLLFGLCAGLAFFLFGMNIMSSALQRSAGDKMRAILSSLTKNNFIGLSVGAFVTIIVQSSSATSVMLVSFVNSGLMRFKQSLSILLGAAVGTTITAQLIAFRFTDYSLFFIGIGGLIYLFINKNTIKNIGESIFGFGILFFGMFIMSESMEPLRFFPPFIKALYSLHNPFVSLLIGTIFTALVQSSAATLGIVMMLASQGLLTLESSIALVLGANLGTPVTALLASIKAIKDAKRVAVALAVYKLFMVVVFIGFIPVIADAIERISFSNLPLEDLMPRQIANAHTYINIVMALLFLPLLSWFEKLIVFLIPSQESENKEIKVRYLSNSMLQNPILALQLAKEETLRLGRKINDTLELVLEGFTENNPSYLQVLEQKRDENKFIRDAIRDYLLKIPFLNSSKKTKQTILSLQHAISELSHINDALTKILHRRAEKWIERNYVFSEEEKREIIEFHAQTVKLYILALQVFKENRTEDVLLIKSHAKHNSKAALEIEKAHYERLLLNSSKELENSKTYLELINMFKTISIHSLNLNKI